MERPRTERLDRLCLLQGNPHRFTGRRSNPLRDCRQKKQIPHRIGKYPENRPCQKITGSSQRRIDSRYRSVYQPAGSGCRRNRRSADYRSDACCPSGRDIQTIQSGRRKSHCRIQSRQFRNRSSGRFRCHPALRNVRLAAGRGSTVGSDSQTERKRGGFLFSRLQRYNGRNFCRQPAKISDRTGVQIFTGV